jgi:imidazolonepropionase-like amidohydrolase
VQIPADAQRLDLAGKTVLPGLIDIHAHGPQGADDIVPQQNCRMLRGLPPRQRAAIVLTEIFGYNSEQAAQIMRIRPTTVRALASQGRAALRVT